MTYNLEIPAYPSIILANCQVSALFKRGRGAKSLSGKILSLDSRNFLQRFMNCSGKHTKSPSFRLWIIWIFFLSAIHWPTYDIASGYKWLVGTEMPGPPWHWPLNTPMSLSVVSTMLFLTCNLRKVDHIQQLMTKFQVHTCYLMCNKFYL